MNKQLLVALVLILLVGAFFVMRTGKSSTSALISSPSETASNLMMQDTGSGSPSAAMPMASQLGASTDNGAKEFTVTGSNFKFEPAVLTVKKGDTVTINFANSGGMHDWVLDEFNVRSKRISAGETDKVTFTADKTGTFEYYCSVGSHRQMGMVGKLTVQ